METPFEVRFADRARCDWPSACRVTPIAFRSAPRYDFGMRIDQRIVVGGTRDGERVTSEPMPANDAIRHFYTLRAQDYSQLTMTDADTGQD